MQDCSAAVYQGYKAYPLPFLALTSIISRLAAFLILSILFASLKAQNASRISRVA